MNIVIAFVLLKLYVFDAQLIQILICFTALEWCNPSKSALCTVVIIAFFSIGQMLLSGIAYIIPNWRILQLVLFCPLVLFLVAHYW